MYQIFILHVLHVSGILECLVFFLLKHYNSLSLAFALFTTDAHSVLSKSPCSSAFYTLIPEVHFNIIHLDVGHHFFSLRLICLPLPCLLPFTFPSYNVPKLFQFEYFNDSYNISKYAFIFNFLIHLYCLVTIIICWPTCFSV